MQRKRWSYGKDIIALCALAFIILLYFNRVLSCEYIFTERDLAPFFIPPKFLWVKMVKVGELPLWNPYNYSGLPLLAALQPGVLYPPHLLYLVLPFNVAWNWVIIIHFIFAGASVYCLLRHMGASGTGSFLGGLIFMLSGYMLSIHDLLTHLFSIAWFPIVLLFYLKHIESGRRYFLVLASIALTFEFLGGAPEIVLATGGILLLITVFPGYFTDRISSLHSRLTSFVTCCGLFVLLSSIQLLPFAEMIRYSIRRDGLSYKETITWSFAFRDIIQLFLPDFFAYSKTIERYWENQSWLKTIYLGLAPFFISIFYFTSKDKKRWVLLFLMAISFICALGGNTPLYKILHKLPPFNSIRYPVKFLFLFFFVISISSGLGLDALRAGAADKDRRIAIFVKIIFYVGFVLAVFWGFLNVFDGGVRSFMEARGIRPDQYNDIWFNMHNAKRFLFFSLMACIIIFLYFRKKQKNIFLAALILVVIMDLFLANYGFYHVKQWREFIGRNDFIENIPADRDTARYLVSVRTEKDFDRYLFGKNIAGPAYAAIYGTYSLQGSEVIRCNHSEFFLRLLFCGSSIVDAQRLIDAGGVRYVATSYLVENDGYSLLHSTKFDEKTAFLYENLRYKGRFFLSGLIHKVRNEKEMMQKLTDKSIDLRKEIVVITEESDSETVNDDVRGSVELNSYGPIRAVFTAELDNKAFLYLSDTYYPGWRAYVDGKETKIYRANLAFRAIKVPGGRHTVVFKYVPMSFYIGLALTLLGIALCVWLWRRDRKMLAAFEDGKDSVVPDDKGGGT